MTPRISPRQARQMDLLEAQAAHAKAAVPVVVRGTPTTHETENHSQQRVCRDCGCTDDHACPGGCWWIDETEYTPDGPRLRTVAASGPICSRCHDDRHPR